MGVGSIFLLLILVLVAIGAVFTYFGLRAAAGRDAPAEGPSGPRPEHAVVTTPYHEHVETPAAARERDRTATQPEHQTE